MNSTIAPTKAPAAAPSRMTLAAVTSGRLSKPPRVLLYGTDGIGKSTFGSRAPAPIFLCAEDGTAGLDVARFPEPTSWTEVLAAVDALIAGGHGYRTLVVDTLDWLEPLIFAHLCQANGWKDIEAPGYGKGYVAALDQWRLLLARLDALRERQRMAVVLLAHTLIRNFKSPESEAYDRYELKLNAKAGGLLREWCDVVLFGNYETLAAKRDGRVLGVSTGARIMFTEHRATWDAKNRYGLPAQLPLSWDELEQAMATGHLPQLEQLRAEVAALLPQVDEQTRGLAEGYLANNGDNPAALYKLADKLRAKAALNTTTPPATPGTDKEVAA